MSLYAPPVSREDPDDQYERLTDQDAQERLDVELADHQARYFDEFVFAAPGVGRKPRSGAQAHTAPTEGLGATPFRRAA